MTRLQTCLCFSAAGLVLAAMFAPLGAAQGGEEAPLPGRVVIDVNA